MELRHLRAFLAVARHGHFTHAAAAIGLAQPALSQHIAQLEDELGVRLFERARRGALVTDAGRAFLPRAERVLAELSAARSDARDIQGLLRGRVVIGSVSSIAVLRLPSVLARFRVQHPGIELAVRESHSAPLIAQLASGGLDLALIHAGSIRSRRGGSARAVIPADVASAKLWDEDLVLAVPRRHRLAGSGQVALAELASESFVIYEPGSMLRDVVMAAGAAAGFTPRIALEASSNDTVRAFIAAGFGIALLPRSLTAALGPPIAVVEVSAPRVVRTVSIAWRRHGTLAPATRATLELLRTSLSADSAR